MAALVSLRSNFGNGNHCGSHDPGRITIAETAGLRHGRLARKRCRNAFYRGQLCLLAHLGLTFANEVAYVPGHRN